MRNWLKSNQVYEPILNAEQLAQLQATRAIELDLDPDGTGKVFNVLGDIFPANLQFLEQKAH